MTRVIDAPDRHRFRWYRMRLAMATSVASKLIGILLQLFVVPVTIKSLGIERFGIYTMLVSGFSWIDLARVGIGPGLTRELAAAWNRNDVETERRVFSSAFYLLLIAGLGMITLAALGLAVAHWTHWSLYNALGVHSASYRSEIALTLPVLGVYFFGQIVLSACESARSGYQEEYVNNIANSCGNALAIGALLYAAEFAPTIPAMAVATFGSLILSKIGNFSALIFRRPMLRPRLRDARGELMRVLFVSSLSFWSVQLGTFFLQNLSLVQLGTLTSPTVLAPFAVSFRIFQLASTFALMITTPMWPAITDAYVRGDLSWIRTAKHRVLRTVMLFAVVFSIMMIFMGPLAVKLWSHGALEASRATVIALALYFPVWMWNHCNTMVLYGLGKIHGVGITILAEGIAALGLSALLTPHMGPLGTATALLIAGIATSGVVLPWLIKTHLPDRDSLA